MTALAEHPQTLRIFTEASAENASLTELRAAVHL
jgi:hypothetical protein